MKTQDQAARARADRKRLLVKKIKKSYGKTPSEMSAEERRAVRAELADPKMDKRIKKIYGKTLSEMSAEECRVIAAEFRVVAAYQEHWAVAVAEAVAAHKAAKILPAFWELEHFQTLAPSPLVVALWPLRYTSRGEFEWVYFRCHRRRSLRHLPCRVRGSRQKKN
jgi:hypothetical protein